MSHDRQPSKFWTFANDHPLIMTFLAVTLVAGVVEIVRAVVGGASPAKGPTISVRINGDGVELG